MRRGGSHLVFPSRVDTFKLSGPGLSWGEALFEGGLRKAVLHADSSSIGSYGVSLARITRASWCLWCSACIPGLGWIPGAISITNCIVMMPLIRGVTGLLALWPVALASSSISWKYLSLRLAGPDIGMWDSCSSLSWCWVSLVSTCEDGSRGTGGRWSSRGITWASQGHRCNRATSRSGWVTILWMGHLSKWLNVLLYGFHVTSEPSNSTQILIVLTFTNKMLDISSELK